MTEPAPGSSQELREVLVDRVRRDGRDAVLELREQARAVNASRCAQCDGPLPEGSRRKTCSDRCRQARRRERRRELAARDDRDGPQP